jgi:aerobic carbon-monoxide dehydrogenase medium subunit
MKPAPFEYIAPDSLAAALDLISQYGDDAKLLAGGQSLIPAMNFRLVQPTMLIDLNRVANLDYVNRTNEGGLRIGALTRHRRLERDPAVAQLSPLLAEAMPHVAHVQIRNRGTIGGSLAHADPAAELPVIMVALEAQFLLQNTAGKRWRAAADFFQGIFTTELTADEILTEIYIPRRVPASGYAFVEFARRQGDYALLGVAAVLSLAEDGRCHRARLVYLNAGERPVDATLAAALLAGQPVTPELIEAAANLAAGQEIDPSGDIHASPTYLRHLARVLTRRALNLALERALFSAQETQAA